MIDYEQKYKEAPGRANAKIETYNHLGNTSAVKSICEIFPELRESEEETVRKEIIDFIKENIIITEEQRYMWLDWLEKLGKLNERVWSMEELRELNAVRHLNPGLDSLYLKLKGE